MEHFIGCDAHKKFSVFASINEKGEYGPTFRVGHDLKLFREFLKELPAGSQIALETSGCYYWMVDEMERAGHIPRLAHALTAKRRMEGRHKTNSRDARGLAMLLRNGTLPEVWIPPAELRDQREMLRWRMYLSQMRTRVKNRIHGVLQRYNIDIAVGERSCWVASMSFRSTAGKACWNNSTQSIRWKPRSRSASGYWKKYCGRMQIGICWTVCPV